jgi:hypothetical protein
MEIQVRKGNHAGGSVLEEELKRHLALCREASTT